MRILAGILFCYIISYFAGKKSLKMKSSTYAFLALLSMIQVAYVMYMLSITEFPRP